MCKKSGKSIDHLLLYCNIARDVNFGFPFFWDRVRNAPMDGGVFGEFKRSVQ
jgi:hypothetical protein